MKSFSVPAIRMAFILLVCMGVFACGGQDTEDAFSDSPVPEATAAATPTATPTATPIPEVTATATPIPTATPTASVTPTPTPAATLAEIQAAIFTPTCAVSGCHTGSTPQRGLNLSNGLSFSNLVGVVADESDQPATFRVLAGNPDDSYIVRKIEGDSTILGSRMPAGGAAALTVSQINMIRSWISTGAAESSSDGAQVLLTKVHFGPSSIAYTINLSSPVDPDSISEGSALIYFIQGDLRFLGEASFTSIEVIGNQLKVRYQSAPPFAYDSIELQLNNPSHSALLDLDGYYVDADADGEPGGMHIHVLSTQ